MPGTGVPSQCALVRFGVGPCGACACPTDSGPPRARRYETIKAADAVAALKASLKPVATVKRDGKWQNIDAVLLVPGDMVLLGAGSSVPADCIVNKVRAAGAGAWCGGGAGACAAGWVRWVHPRPAPHPQAWGAPVEPAHAPCHQRGVGCVRSMRSRAEGDGKGRGGRSGDGGRPHVFVGACGLTPMQGRIEVDQSALTGESLPVTMYGGDSAKMGSTITRGEVEATVEASPCPPWLPPARRRRHASQQRARRHDHARIPPPPPSNPRLPPPSLAAVHRQEHLLWQDCLHDPGGGRHW